MRPTLEYIKEKFDYYNKLCFGGSLPKPPIRLNMRYGTMGLTRYECIRQSDESITYENISIEISVRRDLPEVEYIDTLVHEMVHYYILVNNLNDDSPHGHIFRSKIKEISERYGIRISIAFDPTEEELIKTISDRYRYICVLDFEDGRIGMAVVARGKLFDLWFEMRKCLHAKSVKWYASNRAIFEKIPISLSPKCYIIDADKLLHYLTGAVELERSGDIIKQK